MAVPGSSIPTRARAPVAREGDLVMSGGALSSPVASLPAGRAALLAALPGRVPARARGAPASTPERGKPPCLAGSLRRAEERLQTVPRGRRDKQRRVA